MGQVQTLQPKTADIVLVNSNPKDVANLILFGKATYRKMIQNLGWATGCNVVALHYITPALCSARGLGSAHERKHHCRGDQCKDAEA